MPEELDHIDGNRSNNAIGNLRLATRTQNNFNGRSWATGQSGLRGAYLHYQGHWYSKIQVGGQVIWLGNFGSAQEAHAAYLKAADLYAGEYAFHNREVKPPVTEAC
jgi:hypothetical protein